MTSQAAQLLGWVRHLDHVMIINLPVPPTPQPFAVTTLHVPALGAYLSAIRTDQRTYPDEIGSLHRDEHGTPRTLTLLARDWVVLAQIDHGVACEITDGDQHPAQFDREVRAALNVLEAYHHD